MSTECYPVSVLPHVTQLYRDFLAMSPGSEVSGWYGGNPFDGRWMGGTASGDLHLGGLADALQAQSVGFGAGPLALANIQKLRAGAKAVVTGQQVGLFGGPLLTLFKAATAVARAAEATTATGIDHVPVFWLATEDHDLAEIDHVALLTKKSVETIKADLKTAVPLPVGGVALHAGIEAALEQASELLAWAPIAERLRHFYAPGATLGEAFARLLAELFAAHGLIVMDAAARDFHALGAPVLRAAIERGAELEEALLARSADLKRNYHAQVLVKPGASLLFLVDQVSGERLALRRPGGEVWKAAGQTYSTADLLAILDEAPERISPNALLRPVFQDAILPTAAYVGGPAEIAYFAQSAVLYEKILGRITPVLPRLSATLIEPAIAKLMANHEVSLPDALTTSEALAQRLGARAMPIAGKRKLAAVGNAMDAELGALTEYLSAVDASLGRAATVSASKMRYQMGRLRRLAATFELQKEASLRKHAEAITLNLFPGQHPQERVVGGVWFVARYGEGLIERLVEEAKNLCPGHVVVRL